MVLGTESDITELIDRFYRQEFNHKAVYQLLARSPKESAARVFTPSQVMVGYLGHFFCGALHLIGGTP